MLAACGTSGGGAETGGNGSANAAPVRIGYLQASAGLPVLVAQQQGFFSKHGLNVELTGHANPVAAVQVLGRSLDIVQGTSTDAPLAAANGRDIQILSGAYQEADQNKLFSVIAPSKVASLNDLRGLKIGTPSLAGISYYALVHALSTAGLSTNDVQIVQVAYADMASQLKAGVIDAALNVDPFRGSILQDPAYHDLGDPVLTVANPALIGVYASTRAWLEGHAEQAQAFIAAIDDANAWIDANGDSARGILVKDLNMPQAAAQSVVLPDWDTSASPEGLQPWLNLLAELKVVPAGQLPKATDLFYRS